MEGKIKALSENKIMQIVAKVVVIVLAIATIAASTHMYMTYVFDGTKSMKFNAFMGLSLLGMVVATAYIAWLLIRKKGFTYERLYLVLAISLGISMQIIMPCFSGPDENVHFLSAYNASSIYSFDIIDDWHMYMRSCDGDYYQYFLTFPQEYELLADGNWVGITPEQGNIFIFENVNIFWPRYVLTGLGIRIARSLHLGLVGLMYAGRLMNTILLVILGYFCVKLTPIGKPQVVSLAMLPLFMEMCNSYSYDINTIMTALLFTILCIRYSQESFDFKFKHAFLLAVVLASFIANKIAYVVFAVLIFMIPHKKWKGLIKKYAKGTADYKKQRNLIIVAVAMACVLLPFLLYHYGDTVLIVLKRNGQSVESVGGAEAFSAAYILGHPGETLGLIWSTWKLYGWQDFKNVIGGYLGNHKIAFFTPDLYIVGIIVAVAAGFIAGRLGKATGLDKRRYIVMLITTLVVLASVYLGSLIRFTPIEGSDRVQVSYRYYLPIFVSGLICTGTDQRENKLALSCLFIQNIFYTGAMCYVLYHLITL